MILLLSNAEHMCPQIDPERAVAAGHSFGGYSIK
jgi:predicted dienelactone hydrolase